MNPTGKRGLVLRRQWKNEVFGDMKPTVYDWCRLAAFIDGEGTLDINTCRSKPSFTVRLQIGNTNPKLAVWLTQTFGGSVKIFRLTKRYPKWKDSYVWSCMSTRAAWAMHNCLPWLILKDAQAQLLMWLQEDIDKTRQGRGRRVASKSIEFRNKLKADLHALNAKGPANQIVMTKEDFDVSR